MSLLKGLQSFALKMVEEGAELEKKLEKSIEGFIKTKEAPDLILDFKAGHEAVVLEELTKWAQLPKEYKHYWPVVQEQIKRILENIYMLDPIRGLPLCLVYGFWINDEFEKEYFVKIEPQIEKWLDDLHSDTGEAAFGLFCLYEIADGGLRLYDHQLNASDEIKNIIRKRLQNEPLSKEEYLTKACEKGYSLAKMRFAKGVLLPDVYLDLKIKPIEEDSYVKEALETIQVLVEVENNLDAYMCMARYYSSVTRCEKLPEIFDMPLSRTHPLTCLYWYQKYDNSSDRKISLDFNFNFNPHVSPDPVKSKSYATRASYYGSPIGHFIKNNKSVPEMWLEKKRYEPSVEETYDDEALHNMGFKD